MEKALRELQERLCYSFADASLLWRALTHASAAGDDGVSNERLEFLGDAVVGLAMSERLFHPMPESAEGDMTVIKSEVVSRVSLAAAAREMGLAELLVVDEGLRRRGAYSDSMLCGAFEAVAGAIFLDGGMGPAREFVLRALDRGAERARERGYDLSYKSLLQHRTQARGAGVPRYTIARTVGPSHRRRFQAAVRVGGEECGTGWGATKKDAERNAAREALDRLYPGWLGSDGGP